MKKRLFGIFLALTLAFTCFAVAACGKKEEKPIGDPVTVELGYAEDTGMLSWSAVEGATKYTIRLNNVNDSAKSEVTTATSLQLYLRRGSTRISLIAEDEQGRERGNGTKTVTLESDFGAPAQVTGIAYDKAAGTLGWTASEGAVKYLVSATSVNNDEFVSVADAEVTATSYAVALGKGVYDVSVVAISDKGAKSVVANYRYASYVDSAYGTEITEGVYKLFDFEDENVTDLSRFNKTYKAWSQENKKPEWAIVNKHEKVEDSPEADTVDFTSNALKVRAAYNAEGDTLTRTSAVTFTLPEPLENWGRIYYDMFRTQNPSAGVLLTDVTGKRVLKSVEYSHGATLGKWGTVSFTRSEVLESEPEFGALAEISFVLVNGKGGVAYFDNVRYDMVDIGYFGNCGYVRSTDTFTFDEVSGAKKYEMYVDGATDPIELTQAEYVFDPALTTGNHEIRIVAINGESTREHTFDLEVGERPVFNVENPTGSGEYVLADFNTVEYREYFATTARTSLGRYYNYAIADGKLNITHNEDWGNGYLLYTLPEAIDGAKVVYFNGVTTSHKYYIGVVYRDSWTSGDETTNIETIRGDALGTAKDLVYTVPAERAGNPIVAIKIMASYVSDANGVAKTISLDSITYLTENGIGKLGDDCKYVRSTDVFTFGAAYNAESYDVYVDGATDPISCDTASCDLSANPLAAGTHSIRVVAKRGDASRERTYSLTVGERPVFNVETAEGSTEYILADFETVEYNEYLSLAGERASMGQTKYSVTDGKLVIDPLVESGFYQTVKYTFPEPIAKADIHHIRIKLTTTETIRLFAFDENGNKTADGWLSNPRTEMGVAAYYDFSTLEGDKVSAIAFTLSNWQKQSVVHVEEITYIKYAPVTGFNSEIAGTSDRLLADFNASGYSDHIEVAGAHASWGATKWSVGFGYLTIDPLVESGFNQVVKYTFPEPITKANMLNIKVKFSTTNSIKIYAFDELGNKTGTDKDGEWLGGGNMAVSIYTGFRSLAGDKITAIAFTLHNWQKQAVVNIDEITYEYIDPVTNFNTKVEGTENEYLLADFSVSGYKQYLENVGSGRYSLVENGLSVTGASWNNNAVKYTLPSSIAVGDIEKIKVEFIVTGGKHGVVRASDGTNYSGSNTGVSPMEFTINTTEITGDKIVSFLLSCNDTSTAIVYTKITYVKKTA